MKTHRSTVFVLTTAAGMTIMGLLGTLIVLQTGDLRYSLDDPYIHLRVSELIARGGYGVNIGEPAAPSSSILFPFLLAPFAGTAVHAYVPLLLCLAATLVSLWYLAGLAAMSSGTVPPAPSALRSQLMNPAFQAAFIVMLGGALNLFGIVFTGLEHSLHIALSIGIIAGCVQLLERDLLPRLLVLLIILCPLIRFEGLALSGVAILLLIAVRRWRAALLAGGGIGLGLAGWALFARIQGLPLLPSSVATKSQLVADGLEGGGLSRFIANTLTNLDMTTMSKAGQSLLLMLLATLTLLAVQAWRLRDQRRPVITCLWLALLALGTVGAHAVAGRYGWFGRYENYARLVCIAIVIWALFGASDPVTTRPAPVHASGHTPLPWRWLATAAVASVTVLAGRRSLEMQATLLTPAAAAEVYSQQYQMARFAHDYARVPVAVNDLGLVSYHSDHYVLDLWGLGSEPARIARSHATANAADWIAPLIDAHDVQLAMIYAKWFPMVPDDWCHLGNLTLDHPSVIPIEAPVAFFATSAEAAPKLQAALEAFVGTLPRKAMFTFATADHRGCPMPEASNPIRPETVLAPVAASAIRR